MTIVMLYRSLIFFCLIHSIFGIATYGGLRSKMSTQTIWLDQVDLRFDHRSWVKFSYENIVEKAKKKAKIEEKGLDEMSFINGIYQSDATIDKDTSEKEPEIKGLVDTFEQQIVIDGSKWEESTAEKKGSKPKKYTHKGLAKMTKLPGTQPDSPPKNSPSVTRMFIATLAENTKIKKTNYKEGNIVSACECSVIEEPPTVRF